jgi:hypothetical protein
MKEAVSAALLKDLSYELSNEELGAAIRVVTRICETQKPVARRTIHITAGMDRKRWDEMEDDILKFFDFDEQGINLFTSSTASPTDRFDMVFSSKGRQRELPMVRPTTRRPSLPQYAKDEKPPAISIRKAIWDQAIHIFKAAGMSEKTARSILAGMLKNYPEGDVAMAVSDAAKKDVLAEPHTWIIGRLKGEARKRKDSTGKVPPATRNQVVTPELGGISQNRAKKIRQKNASLRLRTTDHS